MPPFADWDSFYVIVGSAAGGLIGLQFVVMTLIAERPPVDAEAGNAAFSTPTIVHFSSVLLLAALVRVPWDSAGAASVALGVFGLGGVLYELIVVRRMIRQKAYKPELEDWIFHGAFPVAAYLVLAASGFAVSGHAHRAVFGLGLAALMLLFTGIHNAWDAVAYHVLKRRAALEEDRP